MAPRPSPPEGTKPADRLKTAVTVVAAALAASAIVCGFLSAREAGQASDEARAGLIAQGLASERSIQVGRIFDADFDYITEAELGAFRASQLEARGLLADAEMERAVALYLLQSTYGYADAYYSDAIIEEAVYSYNTTGFDRVWNAFSTYVGDLQADVDAMRAEADAHLRAASLAGREATALTMSVVLMGVAVALGTVALSITSFPLRQVLLGVILTLLAIAWANVAWTFFT